MNDEQRWNAYTQKSMALPTLSAHVPSRARELGRQIARQREQEARWRQQWEMHAQYFREQNLRGHQQAIWTSRRSYQQSMSAYHKDRLEAERRMRLEQRRTRLKAMLQEETDQLEAELRAMAPDRKTLTSQLVYKSEELRTLREERRKKLAQDLLKEHWRQNNPELRKVESALHTDHVVGQWKDQMCEKKQHDVAEQEETRRFENEYERTRKEALERIMQEEEKRKAEGRQRAEELRQQMEELKLREEEAGRLKKEQDTLLAQQWELDKMEEERRRNEEKGRKLETRRFLVRQYRAQLKRRAQQVQEELEADRKILAALMEGEQDDKRLESVRKERAVADVAWMKHVIEEQLQLERQREAEFELLYREEAQRVWEKREAEWEKERRARERLMQEVLLGRQQQLELKTQLNREAQEESLRRREQLIQELELEREARRQEREQDVEHRSAQMHEINAQVEQRRQDMWEEQHRRELEGKEEMEALRTQEEELRLETQRMAKQGYQGKVHSRPRSAWT